MSDDQYSNDDTDLVVQEARPKLKKPRLYKVILMNDDYTPMEFVVLVLEKFFQMDNEKATQVMLQVHTQGKAVCGVFTKEIAETRVALVDGYAKQNEQPLLCVMEAD
ncbi:MAG TPA: ATP-dependent Clp protease adapter ClpS [Gammaproteobacteria bacterium]|nr:ATP-dependent Clp protease adapter ClpS [Gammaproteobacteria bacterium]